jgi:four helix bundle protein
MDKFRFLRWKVYQDAKLLFGEVLDITTKLPRDLKYELGNQIVRSSFSVVLNIAEGSGKSTDKDMNRYFDVAIGSVNETLAGLDVLKDNSLIGDELFQGMMMRCEDISKQLGGFKKRLK